MIVKCKNFKQVNIIVYVEKWWGWNSDNMINQIGDYFYDYGNCCIDIINEQFSPYEFYVEECPDRNIVDFENSVYSKPEKPVIKCKELAVNMNPSYGYEIQFINLKNNEIKTYKGTLSCEEKDGMLITDDFIFVKEGD